MIIELTKLYSYNRRSFTEFLKRFTSFTHLEIVFLNRDKGVPEFCVDSVMSRKILSHCINDPFRLVFPITAVFLMASW
jgi:hypothetical protein